MAERWTGSDADPDVNSESYPNGYADPGSYRHTDAYTCSKWRPNHH
jgi:hypothetical protein